MRSGRITGGLEQDSLATCGLHVDSHRIPGGVRYFEVWIHLSSGKIKLPLLDNLPLEIRSLYESEDHDAKEFSTNIRKYNSSLAMTSIGQDAGEKLKVITTINNGGAPWVYRVQGQLHHISGTSLAPTGKRPCFAQLYIYDPEDALNFIYLLFYFNLLTCRVTPIMVITFLWWDISIFAYSIVWDILSARGGGEDLYTTLSTEPVIMQVTPSFHETTHIFFLF